MHFQDIKSLGEIAHELCPIIKALTPREIHTSSHLTDLPWDTQDATAESMRALSRFRRDIRTKAPGMRVGVTHTIDTGELGIMVCAAGYEHADGVAYVNGRFSVAADRNGYEDAVRVGTDGKLTIAGHVVAPDGFIHSYHAHPNREPGQPGHPITFVMEVERNHRTLLELIRHLGAIFRSTPGRGCPPTINGVLGIQLLSNSGEPTIAALFLIQRGNPNVILAAYDFGTNHISDARIANANRDMAREFGVAPVSWTRAPDGQLNQSDVIVEIPFPVVVNGVLPPPGGTLPQMAGGTGTPVEINLRRLIRNLRGD